MNACRHRNNCHVHCQARTAPVIMLPGCCKTAEHPLPDQDIQSCSPLALTESVTLAFPSFTGHVHTLLVTPCQKKGSCCHLLSSKLFGDYCHCMKTSQHNNNCPKEVPEVCSETSQEKGWLTLLQVSLVNPKMVSAAQGHSNRP